LASITSAKKVHSEIGDIPPQKVKASVSEYLLTDFLPKGYFKGYDFFQLESVEVRYTPMKSKMSAFSVVSFYLVDDRQLSGKETRIVKWNSNVSFTQICGMDHAMDVDEADRISFKLEWATRTMEIGATWCAVVIRIKIVRSKDPFLANMQRTVGMYNFSDTMVKNHNTNPAHLDMVMDEEDRQQLIKQAKLGKLVDHSQPAERRRLLEYSKSEAGGSDDQGDGNKLSRWINDPTPRDVPVTVEEVAENVSNTGSEATVPIVANRLTNAMVRPLKSAMKSGPSIPNLVVGFPGLD